MLPGPHLGGAAGRAPARPVGLLRGRVASTAEVAAVNRSPADIHQPRRNMATTDPLTRDIQALDDSVVVGTDGSEIGRVGQVYTDNDTGQPSWVTVKTGWFGTNESFVPL